MVDIKREDITLSDRTKGISVDEFAWGSYFYSESISSGYSTKGFELGYRFKKDAINNRENWYSTAIAPTNWGFATFTRDGKVETVEHWNSVANTTGDTNYWWALYSFYKWGSLSDGYLNWVKYWNYLIGIRQTHIDVLDYENIFDPSSEILTNTDMSVGTGWVLWTGWTTYTDIWIEHTIGETDTLTSDISSAWLTSSDYCRIALKISWWTEWTLTFSLGWASKTCNDQCDWWLVETLACASPTTTLTITPSSSFNGVIRYINLHSYDMSKVKTYSIDWLSDRYPALVWEWDLYIGSEYKMNIVNLKTRGVTTINLIDRNFKIVDMTQQAWNIIIWATDGADSRQYYWNGVDAVATEVIEWKGLIIQWVTGTETISYVLTTSWVIEWTVRGYEYRLYAVSWYQRSLIASKLYDEWSEQYVSSSRYNPQKKFDFDDVRSENSMIVFLDSLCIPWADWVYKYGNDIWGLSSAWTRPIKYDTWATHIVLGQSWHHLGLGLTCGGVNYIWDTDNRLYSYTGYLVTNSIYWDRLSSRKSLEKIKIWYRSVASTVGNIKVYAIVDDTYFWRFTPSSTPTTRPAVWDVYTVANNTKAKVIDVTDGIITLVTTENKWSYNNQANTTLTKVSWTWDASISVGYNYDNMCLIKTIETPTQWYGADFIFWKNFVENNLPYRYKIQFVIELNTNNRLLSPEIYDLSIHADITDVVL